MKNLYTLCLWLAFLIGIILVPTYNFLTKEKKVFRYNDCVYITDKNQFYSDAYGRIDYKYSDGKYLVLILPHQERIEGSEICSVSELDYEMPWRCEILEK